MHDPVLPTQLINVIYDYLNLKKKKKKRKERKGTGEKTRGGEK